MKNKRILRIIAVCVMAVIMVTALASCAMGGSSAASDKSGEGWEYVKGDDQTLTITDMPEYEGADEVPWKDVASSVKKVVVEDETTGIPDYAFYNMTLLEDVELPDTVESIGELAFAFTPALTGIDLPKEIKSIGYGAFEASGIKAIELPAGVTEIAERTFIYCDDLTSVIAPGVTKVCVDAFTYCSALDCVKLADGADVEDFANAGIAKENIKVADGMVEVTYKHVNKEDDSKIGDVDFSETRAAGETFTYAAPEIDGYKAVKAEKECTLGVFDTEIVVEYEKKEEETESVEEVESDEETEPEKLSPWTWVALIGTVVILIGVAVAVILFVRHDKKNAGGAKNSKKGKK